MEQLRAAFEDNAAPAAPLSVEGAEATMTVLVPEDAAIPTQMPGQTAAGNVSIRKMSKAERDSIVSQMVAAYMLATVKEAFAVAPALSNIRIVAVRSTGVSAYGHRQGEVIAAARITRDALAGVQWQSVDALRILKDTSAELVLNERGATRALHPLDVSKEPELAGIIAVIDFDELGDA